MLHETYFPTATYKQVNKFSQFASPKLRVTSTWRQFVLEYLWCTFLEYLPRKRKVAKTFKINWYKSILALMC